MNYQDIFEQGISYTDYVQLIDRYVKEGKTSGLQQTEAYVNYTKLNKSRMRRVSKRFELSETQVAKITSFPKVISFLVITETWCPDAATNAPIFAKICELNTSFDIKFVFRDEQAELMDSHLTNGARSIPKVLFLDGETKQPLAEWGPRPQHLQDWLARNKKSLEHTSSELTELFQRWYIEDRGKSTIVEVIDLLDML